MGAPYFNRGKERFSAPKKFTRLILRFSAGLQALRFSYRWLPADACAFGFALRGADTPVCGLPFTRPTNGNFTIVPPTKLI